MRTVREAMTTWEPRAAAAFNRAYYPALYARRFLHAHRELVSEDFLTKLYEDRLIGYKTNGQRRNRRGFDVEDSGMVIFYWCKETGEDHGEVLRLLADAYLVEHRIERR